VLNLKRAGLLDRTHDQRCELLEAFFLRDLDGPEITRATSG